MDFRLTPAQSDLAQAARRYLAKTYPMDRLAAIADGDGTDPAAWPELVRQGWLDDDLGPVELSLLAEASGYALHPTPWWTTVALTALREPATLLQGSFRLENGRLTGHAPLVPEPFNVAVFVVAVDGQRFAVRREDASVRPLASLDRLRRMGSVRLDRVPAALLDARACRAGALLAAEAVGVAARAMDFAVEYAKTREQFGRPIGSFQALAHQLTEGYVELELARSLALRAAWLDGDESADACAIVAARQAAVRCCELAIQTLGGMGVTWEHPMHHWLRRALWLESFALPGPQPHAVIATAVLSGDRS